MKAVPLLALFASICFFANAQLKTKPTCDAFFADLLDGKINGVPPDLTAGQIKNKLPCFTSEDLKCGGIIVFKDRDLKFYTDRHYVEIGPAFKGKLSLPLMGGKRGTFFKWLGYPKLKDESWDAFQTKYGCLVLYYNATSRVRMIRFSTKGTETLNLCE